MIEGVSTYHRHQWGASCLGAAFGLLIVFWGLKEPAPYYGQIALIGFFAIAASLYASIKAYFVPRGVKPAVKEDPNGFKVHWWFDPDSIKQIIKPDGEVVREAAQVFSARAIPTNLPAGHKWWPSPTKSEFRTSDLPIDRLKQGSVFFFAPGQEPVERTAAGELLKLPPPRWEKAQRNHPEAYAAAQAASQPSAPPKSAAQQAYDDLFKKGKPPN